MFGTAEYRSTFFDSYIMSIAADLARDEALVLGSWLWVVKPHRAPGDTIARLIKKGIFKPTRAKSGSTMENLAPFGRLVQLAMFDRIGLAARHPVNLCVELELIAGADR